MSFLDVVAVGESLGLLAPSRVGRFSQVRDMRLGFGGAESNVAIGVQRLGCQSAWVGRVGDDGLGELIVREIRAEGVETHAAVDDTEATALMMKERPQAGYSRVVYYRTGQAGSRLSAEDIPEGLIERAKILHITGISAGLGEDMLAALHSAIDRAEAVGASVSFDVNHRSALWRSNRDAGPIYRALASRSDIIFAGDDEVRLVSDAEDADSQLRALMDLGADCAVLKRGERGALAAERSPEGVRHAERQAYPVEVVDTVGAGDAFVAGWLAETARGAELAQRLETAAACGALACTVEGDWEAAPSPSDIVRLQSPEIDPVQR